MRHVKLNHKRFPDISLPLFGTNSHEQAQSIRGCVAFILNEWIRGNMTSCEPYLDID